MGAPLSVVFVLAAMAIALQDVLVTTVSRVLVAHPAVEGGKETVNRTDQTRYILNGRQTGQPSQTQGDMEHNIGSLLHRMY